MRVNVVLYLIPLVAQSLVNTKNNFVSYLIDRFKLKGKLDVL